MNRQSFDLRIQGPSSPADVSVAFLAAFLARLHETVASYVEARSLDVPERPPLVSLLAVRSGSEALELSVPGEAMPALVEISAAVDEESYGLLPASTHQNLYELSEMVVREGWALHLSGPAGTGIRSTTISADRAVPHPPRPSHVEGTTSIVATCLRVGGVIPKAEIRLLKGGTLLYPRLSQEVAKDLAQRLYEDVVLEGRATWRTDTWEVVDFRVDSVAPFRTAPPHEAFEALAEVAEGRWDEEDAVEYVHCLRGSAPVGEP